MNGSPTSKKPINIKNGDYPTDMSALLGKQDFIDAYNDGKWIDWIDEVSGNTATTQKYSLSVSSGTEKTKLFASTSYNREEGLLNNENLNRYSLRLNLDQQIFSWAKVGFTSNLVYRDLNSGVKNTFTKSLSAILLGDAYTEEGEINHEYITGQYSPMSDFIENQYVDNTRSTYLNMSGYVELNSRQKPDFYQSCQWYFESLTPRAILGREVQCQPSVLCRFTACFHHQQQCLELHLGEYSRLQHNHRQRP